ncbi:MAG TPA: glycosyl transferase GT4 family protein, partial [Methanobacteriaceae archaeon]|nr:glycosyl transferase GT4 family protein [Methanobacteriaceae archaeon]
MAMEKPVIVTRLPGISMEFGEGHGLQYVNGSKEVLPRAQKMREEGNIQEEGKKAREFVQSNDWEVITQRFEETLENLL